MTPTTAIVLAAGVGSRLRPLTERTPKCLISIGHETIVGRLVRQLAAAGVRELVVATGHLDGLVRDALRDVPMVTRFAHCHDHATTQNVVSLQRAMALVGDGASVVKFDGDVVLDDAVLTRLFAVGADGAAAVDDRATPPDEAMKVYTRSGGITRFGKGLDAARAAGESIGVECFTADAAGALRRCLDAAVGAGRTDVYYEDVYNDLLDAGRVMRAVTVGDLRWMEVDDADDLSRARAMFGAP